MEQNFKNENNVGVDIPAPEKMKIDAVQEASVAHNADETLNSELKKLFGEDFDISDKFSQDLLLQHLRVNKEQNAHLSGILERDPRLAQLLTDVVSGKRNAHSAMARYFGNSFMAIDEDSPEYEEIMLADEERKEEMTFTQRTRASPRQSIFPISARSSPTPTSTKRSDALRKQDFS